MDADFGGPIDIKAADAKYKLLFECSLDTIFLIDRKGRILDANNSAVVLYGYPRGELLSMSLGDLEAHGDRAGLEKSLAEALAGGRAFETAFRHKDGSVHLAEVRPRSVSFEGSELLLVIVRSAGERVEADSSLAMLASIVESSGDAIAGLTPDGVIVSWNPAAEKLYGYTAKEMVGRRPLAIIPPDRAGEFDRILEKIKRGGLVNQLETVRLRKDGTEVNVSVTATPIKDPDGNLLGVSWVARDVTHRKKVEEELRLARFTLDHATDLIFWIGEDARIYDVNESACKRYGYSCGELRSMSMPDINPTYTRDGWRARWNRVKKKGSLVYETVNRAKDGSLFPVEVAASYLKYGNKELISAYSRDITRRKQAEEVIRVSQERLALAQRAGRIGVFDWDLVSGQVVWTPELEEMFGIIPGKFEDNYQGWASRVHPEDLPRIERYFEEWMKSGRQNGEWEYRIIVDGHERWIDARGQIFYGPGGKALRMIGTNQDVTPRKQTENYLRFIEFTVNNWSDGAIWVTPDARLILVNDATCKMLGYTREELVSMKILNFTHVHNRDNWPGHWKELKEKRSLTFEERFRRKDGSVFPVEVSANYVHYLGFEFNCAFFKDITERKQAEEALVEARNQAELYVDIMAHDINNINQIALINLEFLLLEQGLTPDQRETLGTVLTAVNGSVSIIENVRTIQKIASGELRPETVDIASMVLKCIEEAPKPPGKKVDIRFHSPGSTKVVGAALLKEIFCNLINNSIKYSGREVEIDVAIDEILRDGTRYYRTAITDNGHGIPDEVKVKLFRRFQRGTTKARGKGLGLYIVKMLVERFGGEVWVEDRVPGDYTRGSKFVVLLPVSPVPDKGLVGQANA